jgi:hypothetical protein
MMDTLPSFFDKFGYLPFRGGGLEEFQIGFA